MAEAIMRDGGTYTSKHVAVLLNVSLRTVQRLTAAGEIPGCAKVGQQVRFSAVTVNAWIEAGMPDKATWEKVQRAMGHR